MRRIVIFTMLAIAALPGLTQQKLLDSLLTALHNHPQDDTVKLDILHELAYYYMSNDAEEGLKISDQSIALAQKINDTKRLAVSYSDKATNFSMIGEHFKAMEMYQKAIVIHSKSGNLKGVAKCFFNQGIIYFNLSDYKNATQYYARSLKIFEQLKDTQRMAVVYNSLGLASMYSSNYPDALDHYLKALNIQEKSGSKKDLANVLDNLGLLYRRLFNFNKALEYHQQALKINSEYGSKLSIANSYGNIGIIYDTLHNTAEAIKCYTQALAINESISNKKGIASNLANLGIIYKELPDYTKAYHHINKALTLFKEMGDIGNTSAMLAEIADMYASVPADTLSSLLHTSPQERYARTVTLYEQALQLAESSGTPERQMIIWSGLYDAYKAQKNYKDALNAYTQYNRFHDSIYNSVSRDEIARREIQYEFDKREAQARAEHEKKQLLAGAEIRQQKIVRNTSIGVTLMLFVLAITGSILYKHKRDADAQKKDAEFKVQVADTEMKALRAQMNPHFIFNSLNSINDYISRNDTKSANEYLVKFSKVMRMILENSDQKEIALADDLKALELYIQLEALRLKQQFSYEITVADDIDKENTLIPPLILQPFVENSIWHGLAKKQGEGKIRIIITRENDMLNCIVEDNGVGRSQNNAQANTSKKSLGMKITKARIDIINKLKKSRAAIILSDLAEGTRIEVKLPLELNY